jgi:hypothetical protein
MSAQQSSLDELEKLKKQVDAQREVIEAQTKLIDAERAKQQASALADAKAAKTLADADKAAADARKADAEAQTAALKAIIGEVPASGIKGEVEPKDKAGVTEAGLLAGRSARLAAQGISDDLPSGTPSTAINRTAPRQEAATGSTAQQVLLLYTVAEAPNFTSLLTYRAQVTLVRDALQEADRLSIETNKQAPPPGPVEVTPEFALTGVGLGLDAASKILGYFRSDYAIGGVQLSFDDSLLLHALAGNDTLRQKYAVRLPAQYNADALTQPATGVLHDLKLLAQLKAGVSTKLPQHEKAMADFTAQAAKAVEPAKKGLLTGADLHQKAVVALKGALALNDAFFAKLTSGDDKHSVPLSVVVREDTIARALKDGAALLLIKLQTSGGAYYTKKNLWTFFGRMPFYNMGGVVASYVLMAGPNGQVLKSGVVPIHGGFIKSNHVAEVVLL